MYYGEGTALQLGTRKYIEAAWKIKTQHTHCWNCQGLNSKTLIKGRAGGVKTVFSRCRGREDTSWHRKVLKQTKVIKNKTGWNWNALAGRHNRMSGREPRLHGSLTREDNEGRSSRCGGGGGGRLKGNVGTTLGSVGGMAGPEVT